MIVDLRSSSLFRRTLGKNAVLAVGHVARPSTIINRQSTIINRVSTPRFAGKAKATPSGRDRLVSRQADLEGTALAEFFLFKPDEVVLAEWGAINIKATDVGGEAWEKELVEFKATAYVDVGVRRPTGICYVNDSTS